MIINYKKKRFVDKMNFETMEQKTKTKNKRKRNIVWYNPSFSNLIKKISADNL